MVNHPLVSVVIDPDSGVRDLVDAVDNFARSLNDAGIFRLITSTACMARPRASSDGRNAHVKGFTTKHEVESRSHACDNLIGRERFERLTDTWSDKFLILTIFWAVAGTG
jgi:hypothetical protein